MKSMQLVSLVIWMHVGTHAASTRSQSAEIENCTQSVTEDGLVQMDCRSCGFTSVPSSIPQHVCALFLSNNHITEVDNLPYLPHLTLLDLSSNKIKRIKRSAFQGFSQLRSLFLNGNSLKFEEDLPNGVFETLDNLRELDVSSNAMSPLAAGYRDDVFNCLSQLVKLTMDGLPSAPLGAGFTNLSSLEELTIKGKLGRITGTTFESLAYAPLQSLSIKTACIDEINPVSFSALSSLMSLRFYDTPYLSLSAASKAWQGLIHTNISTVVLKRVGGLTRSISEMVHVNEDFFKGFKYTNLTKLIMEDDYILQIDASYIHEYLPHLEHLSVAYNSLVLIAPLASDLNNLTNIRYVDASHQYRTSYVTGPDFNVEMCNDLPEKLSELTDDVDPRLDKIRDMRTDSWLASHIGYIQEMYSQERNMQHSSVTERGSHGSVHITYPASLEMYNLSEAIFLNEFPIYYLHNTLSLKLIDFSGNGIARFESGLMFPNQSNYNMTLDFSRNDCHHFSKDFFLAESNTAKMIDSFVLNQNKLGPYIALYGLGFVKNLTYLKNLDLSDNIIKTLHRDSFTEMNYLEDINLAENSLRMIDIDLSHNNRLRKLDLSNNLLASLSPAMTADLDSIASSLTNTPFQLNLNDNPFICNCDTQSFLRWILSAKKRDSNIILDNVDEYACLHKGNIQLWVNLPKILKDLEWECTSKLHVIIWACVIVALGIIIALSLFIRKHKWYIRFWFIRNVMRRKTKQNEESELQREFIFDAFVSYHQSDIAWVKHQLLPNTEGYVHDQLTMCLHHRDFIPGTIIEENIVQSIKDSRKTILIISKDFLNSHWCHFELQMARSESFDIGRDVIVPVFLESVADILSVPDLSKTLSNIIKRRTYIEWPNNGEGTELFWKRLRNAIKTTSPRPIQCECGRIVYHRGQSGSVQLQYHDNPSFSYV